MRKQSALDLAQDRVDTMYIMLNKIFFGNQICKASSGI